MANSQWKYQCRTINDANWTAGLPFDVENEYECVDKNHVMGQSHFECSRCGNRYTWIKSLQRHQMICGSEKKFLCCVCNSLFTRKDNLRRHFLEKHTQHAGGRRGKH